MGSYFLAVGIILAILLGWVAVQHLARMFAARHPELGPYAEKTSCCGSRDCGGESCSNSSADDA